MTQVSKYPLSEEVYNHVFEVFLKSIGELKDKNTTWSFVNEFLTPTERVMLAKRFSIAFLLAKDYDYREVAKILRISTSTVARISNLYKHGKYFKQIVDKILKDEKMAKFWEDIGEKITRVLASGGSKAGTWVYIREELKKKKLKRPF